MEIFHINTQNRSLIGINYYHESMGYIERSDAQILSDLAKIKSISNKIKVYHSPYENAGGVSASDSLTICKNIVSIAKSNGLYVSWVENHDDGDNDLNGNGSGAYSWEEYSSLVEADAAEAELVGADEFIVGNEISIHNDETASYYDDTNLPAKIKELVVSCQSSFSGLLGYEDGWWKKDSWGNAELGVLDKIYFTLYEPWDQFKSAADDIYSIFGNTAEIGETSTTSVKSALSHDDDDWTIELMRKYDYLIGLGMAFYLFAFKEPSNNSFGLFEGTTSEQKTVVDYIKGDKKIDFEIILHEEFNSDVGVFTEGGGGSVSSGRLVTGDFSQSTSSGLSIPTSFVFRGTVSSTTVGGADSWRATRLVFRFIDTDNYFFLDVGPNGSRLQLWRREDGEENFLGEYSTTINLGDDYYFEIRCSGTGSSTVIEIFWDSVKVFSITSTGNTNLNTGGVGLRNNGAASEIDDIIVSSQEHLSNYFNNTSSSTEVERAYFVRKAGGANPDETLANIKRRYWLGLLGGATTKGFVSLEKDWLRKIINDNGKVPSSDYLSSLYIEAVVALGGTPSKFINDNRRLVYQLDI